MCYEGDRVIGVRRIEGMDLIVVRQAFPFPAVARYQGCVDPTKSYRLYMPVKVVWHGCFGVKDDIGIDTISERAIPFDLGKLVG